PGAQAGHGRRGVPATRSRRAGHSARAVAPQRRLTACEPDGRYRWRPGGPGQTVPGPMPPCDRNTNQIAIATTATTTRATITASVVLTPRAPRAGIVDRRG